MYLAKFLPSRNQHAGARRAPTTDNQLVNPPQATSEPQLKLATDFSGMDMAAHALKQTDIAFRHLFASESCPRARAHIRRNHRVENLYECALQRPTTQFRAAPNGEAGEEVDIYVAGPPCQPWSETNVAAGGEKDPRGKLFAASLNFILEAKPRTFILENVCGFMRKDGGRHLTATICILRNGGGVPSPMGHVQHPEDGDTPEQTPSVHMGNPRGHYGGSPGN